MTVPSERDRIDAINSKLDELLVAVRGNEQLGVRGILGRQEEMSEQITRLLSYEPELKLVRFIKRTFIYVFIASIITVIGITIKKFFNGG